MSFAEPHNLYLLLPLILLIILGFLLKWYLSGKFSGFLEGETMPVSNLSPWRSWIQGGALSCSFLVMVLAVGSPFKESRVRTYTLMALVDISQSMWCEDYRENGAARSRLDIVKRNLLTLLDTLPAESRLGLAVFAGRGDSVLVLTAPRPVGKARSDLKAMVRSIQYRWTWDDGTSIKDALFRMGSILEGKRDRYGTELTLMLFTDGEEAIGFTKRLPELDPEKFRSVHLLFAGVGTPAGGPIPQFDNEWKFLQNRRNYDGTMITTKLDEAHLKELARLFDGDYRRIETGSDLATLAKEGVLKMGEYESKVDVSWGLWLGSMALFVIASII